MTPQHEGKDEGSVLYHYKASSFGRKVPRHCHQKLIKITTLLIRVTAFLCVINNKEKVRTDWLPQDGSGARDTNHSTTAINLILIT